MERKYLIYRLTAPSGKMYVGLTMQTLKVRWQGHVKRAKTTKNHPLYNAINKYGPEAFLVESVEDNLTKAEASAREKYHISILPIGLRYNISDGGETDGEMGGKIFWAEMDANPEKKAEYVKKLPKIKKDNDWTNYPALAKANAEWRSANPKKAYKMATRAIRIANSAKPESEVKEPRSLKDRLLWKHRRDLATQRSVTKVWAERSEEKKSEIFDKISKAHLKNWEGSSKEKRRKITEKARSSIDRSVQGPAASAGIKNFWAELKKDPEKYKEYMAIRTASLNETNKRKKNENL